jgi:excisionase family DNA binding protein
LPRTAADAAAETVAPPDILSAAETAAITRLHLITVYRALERGEIPGVKIAGRWRVRREDLDKLLAGELR